MKKILLSLGAIVATISAQAATLVYDLGTPVNVPEAPVGQVAKLTLTDTAANTVTFKLEGLWDNNVFGTGSYLATLFINVGSVNLGSGFTNISGDPVVSVAGSGNVAGLPWTDRVNFTAANNVNRIRTGDHAEFSLTASGLSTASFSDTVMVHLRGLEIDGLDETSLFYSNPVPEPGTMAALALGALGVLRRRQAAK